jgi:hypothetical protein
MFPTKSFDDEGHRLEQALRHARVLDAMYGGEGLAGCFRLVRLRLQYPRESSAAATRSAITG